MANTIQTADYQDPFIRELVKYISDSSFQKDFELFFLKHCRSFEDDEEHKLEYFSIYQSFQLLFEKRMERFCEVNGISQVKFKERAENSQESDPVAKHYIKVMLASTEYEHFFALMRTMRRLHGARLESLDQKEILMKQREAQEEKENWAEESESKDDSDIDIDIDVDIEEEKSEAK